MCFWLLDASGCVRGLDREGVNWFMTNDGSTDSDIVLVGVAANAVSGIDLVSGGLHRQATLSGNIWSVDWPDGLSAISAPEPRAQLIVHYRDGRAPTKVALN